MRKQGKEVNFIFYKKAKKICFNIISLILIKKNWGKIQLLTFKQKGFKNTLLKIKMDTTNISLPEEAFIAKLFILSDDFQWNTIGVGTPILEKEVFSSFSQSMPSLFTASP